jgi:hypothetical protein
MDPQNQLLSSSNIDFRDELGVTLHSISFDDIGKKLKDAHYPWERGSGDCGLTRAADGARLSFVFRPELGILLIYEDRFRPYQLVCYLGKTEGSDIAVMRIGGDDTRVPRSWFLLPDEGIGVLKRFFLGERFAEGNEWKEYLVNP